MNILAIDTSTKSFSLAVMRNGEVVCSREIVLEKVLSDSIVPSITKVLKAAKISLPDVDGLAVGLGPGSFTSLRVGVATVKALAFASEKPVVGIPSMDAIAMNVAGEPCDEICVILDARRNLVYNAIYEITGQAIKRKTEYALTTIASLLDQVSGQTLFVGDGIPLFQKEIQQRYAQAAQENATGCQACFADKKAWFPYAKNIAALSEDRLRKGKSDNIDHLVPLYLYPEDCQVQRHNQPCNK